MSETPEQRSRRKIDRLLEQCGWIVQDHEEMNISAGAGVAIREFPLASGHADYLPYADGKAIGIVEAKPEGHTLTGVETQSTKYTTGFPASLPRWSMPLPFAYETTGAVTQFTNALDPQPRSREVFAFHRPAELLNWVNLAGQQLRAQLRQLPALDTSRLWAKQVSAIKNLERSLADNRPRSLIQMATGSGKTFTACNISYRLIKFAKAKRILFLVDRNNLGKQTLTEFQQFASPYNAYKFTEEFGVQHLRKNTIDPAAKVCITTIQRLYSILKGEEEFDEANEESSLFESAPAQSLVKEPLPVIYNAKIPPEFFDFIIVDECHRSIYNIWRQVLEYFDAFMVGLTATPSAQTIGFFGGNLVMEYTHEQAVVDGVNVGYDVYRIQTEITEKGAKLSKQPDYLVPRRDRMTRKKRYAALDNDVLYQASQLDRDVVNESQIRLVVRTFRDKLPEMFPGRTEVPKTLFFAKTDLHADDLTKIIREEFGKGNDFCQKITSKTTGKKPEELLNEFRNSYNPRIAVTVDMIATGTDVKPLECLVFMRNINSAAYFEQMKGRGCRVINPDVLQSVTPDARSKTRFVIVDAVGRTEAMKTLYLSEAWLGIDLELEPMREKMGPLDPSIYKIENLARKEGWFTTKEVGPMVRYSEGPNISDRLGAAKRIIGDKLAEFDRLLNEIEKMDTEQAELFATTFAVWNDLLLDQRPADDDAIIAEVHGWHPTKVEKFPAERIVKSINWMKKKGFVPTGAGPRCVALAA